jgi:hypothetical protein
MAAPPKRAGPSRHGLAEYVLVMGFLALAAAGAVALFGDDIRTAFGVRPPPSATRAARPAPVSAP